jgi:hypothetical protein
MACVALLVIVFSGAGYIAWDKTRPPKEEPPVLELKEEDIEVLRPVVVAGEEWRIRFKVIKYRDVPIIINRKLMNDVETVYTPEVGMQQLGESYKTVGKIVPKNANQGWYYVITQVVANVGPDKPPWVRTWKTPSFYVMDPVNVNTEKLKVLQKEVDKLQVTVKQGVKGQKGETGDVGATGATGPKGATGSPAPAPVLRDPKLQR